MSQDMSGGNTASIEIPKYRCHKEVHALKIADISLVFTDEVPLGTWILTPEDEGYGKFSVDAAYVDKHNPKAGGYYVIYHDGYKSYSPGKVFEEGYNKI